MCYLLSRLPAPDNAALFHLPGRHLREVLQDAHTVEQPFAAQYSFVDIETYIINYLIDLSKKGLDMH
jgi:hypothetical protein